MFEPYKNSNIETILQALLCVININTKKHRCCYVCSKVLNNFDELKGKVKFNIKRLYPNEGGEFKSVFLAFCKKKNICVIVFKNSTGIKK